MSGRRRNLIVVVAALGALGAVPPELPAQIADTSQTPVDSVVITPEAEPAIVPADDTVVLPISPRAAFARSLVIPGWGQAAFDAHTRGGIYFAGWAANWFMIFRNQVRLNEARDRFGQRAAQIEAGLISGSENPDSMRAVLDRDPTILQAAIRADEGPGNTGNNLRKLVRAREQQREDWIAWAIFWVLASGVDAYVTAHLYDMPATIDVQQHADRSVSVGLDVPLPVRRR